MAVRARGRRPGIAPSDQLPEDVRAVVAPAVEILLRVTGVTLSNIRPLPETATLVDVIRKVNEIISRLQED